MGLIEKLLQLILDNAPAGHSHAAGERREFRRALIEDLRRYSVLVEQVRKRFLALHDALAAEIELPSEPSDRLLAAALEEEYSTDAVQLPPDIDAALVRFSGRVPPCAGTDVLERTKLALEQLNALDDAWTSIRPRLDEALEADAVAYLRTYRHEFRRLTQRAIWIVRTFKDPSGREAELVAIYVEAVLFAADQWNAHVVGTIGELRHGRAT